MIHHLSMTNRVQSLIVRSGDPHDDKSTDPTRGLRLLIAASMAAAYIGIAVGITVGDGGAGNHPDTLTDPPPVLTVPLD